MGMQISSAWGGPKTSFVAQKNQWGQPLRPLPRGSRPPLHKRPLVWAEGDLGIVDDFKTPTIPVFVKKPTLLSRLRLEHPLNGYATHGQVVEAHARMVDPTLTIHRVQVPYDYVKRQWDMRAALTETKRQLDNGKVMDAINLSFGVSIPIESLQQDLKLPALTANNIHQYRDTILENFHKVKINRAQELATLGLTGRKNRKYIKDCVDLLEAMAEKVPVFISSGNSGPNEINLMNLARGTVGVGATGARQESASSEKLKPVRFTSGVAEYSAKNGLVTQWGQATKRFIPVKDEKGQLVGLTLHDVNSRRKVAYTREREVLIPLNALHFRKIGGWWEGLKDAGIRNHPLTGTSFASPQVAAKVANQNWHWRRVKEGVGSLLDAIISVGKADPADDV